MAAQLLNTKIFRVAALAVFAVSFLLPAVKLPPGDHGREVVSGWQAAFLTSFATVTLPTGMLVRTAQNHADADGVLLPLIGCVNPLVILLLVLSIWPRLRVARWIVSGGITICLVAAWLFCWQKGVEPLVGHYCWSAGILILILSDLAGASRRQNAAQLDESTP